MKFKIFILHLLTKDSNLKFFFLFIATFFATAQAGTYVIGPSDIITIEIYAGGEIQHQADLSVSDLGTINAPFIGSVKANGLTPSELEERIRIPLAEDYFVNPKVNIHIKEYHSLRYHIFGAVQNPGLYELTSETSLLELIAKAGGIAEGHGKFAFVTGKNGQNNGGSEVVDADAPSNEPIKVDLNSLLEKGDLSANPILHPNDMVYIPFIRSFDLAQRKIYVEGTVANPGAYDYQQGMTALNACIMAGGFIQYAAPNRTRIIRTSGDSIETIRVDLKMVKDGKIADVKLKPGDRIHVPESWL